VSGLPVALKKGPYGHYIQLGAGENGDKPKARRAAARHGAGKRHI
jgi:topoisomerase IA-like protein